MASIEDIPGSMLRKPSNEPHHAHQRATATYRSLHGFRLPNGRSYHQQYGDMYFLRLACIKPAVEQVAAAAWAETVVAGEPARLVDRVLDVRQGELCWVSGTVYMDMAGKPNVLTDVAKDRQLSVAAVNERYYSEQGDRIFLEDDSGRIQLTGDVLKTVPMVTGCIVAVMGTENTNGELETLDLKLPDLAPQLPRWSLASPPHASNGKMAKPSSSPSDDDDDDDDGGDGGDETMPGFPAPHRSGPVTKKKKLAIVSGLSFSGSDPSYALEIELLLEYLLGESLHPDAQGEMASVVRLVVAGNSVSLGIHDDDEVAGGAGAGAGAGAGVAPAKKKKYGYDASAYNPLPSQLLDDFLAQLLPALPVTLLPGTSDPATVSYPQQPVHAAMFPRARAFAGVEGVKAQEMEGAAGSQDGKDAVGGDEAEWGLDAVTNPWEGEIDGWRVLCTGGQNLDDVRRYIDSDDRLGMMEAMCRWQCCAPTAPDTLYSYPFQETDPFVMESCPHVYVVGCQPRFSTKTIEGPEGQRVRLVTVPSFAETRELVLVDLESLEVSRVKFAAPARSRGPP